MRNWGIGILLIVVVILLYFIEFSKVNKNNETANALPTLDKLTFDEASKAWEDFYKVRATIIDGQSATFEIPAKLEQQVGTEMELRGAAVFFSPGCTEAGDKIAVHSFFIYPTLGLANACSHLPEVAMRWIIRVNLQNDWIVAKTEMIDARVYVKGIFRIDTEKPYESVFFLDNAHVEFVNEMEEFD